MGAKSTYAEDSEYSELLMLMNERGMRHRSLAQAVAGQKGSFGFVASQDGGITLVEHPKDSEPRCERFIL
jgi:hypothetical protein